MGVLNYRRLPTSIVNRSRPNFEINGVYAEKWKCFIVSTAGLEFAILARIFDRLTVRERILAHLARFSSHKETHRVPFEVTQEGIADAVGIEPRHLVQNIRPMIKQGLVVESSSYAEGGRQRRKVYFLSSRGKDEAGWLLRDLGDK